MRRGSRSVLVGLVLVLGTSCRAGADDCAELARHVAELAAAEGQGETISGITSGTGTSAALESSCNEQRPTKALVECMMAAQTVAELDAC